MMPRVSRLWAVLCLALIIQFVAARHIQIPQLRDEVGLTTTADLVPRADPTVTATEGSKDKGGSSKTNAPKPTTTQDSKNEKDNKDDKNAKDKKKDATTTFESKKPESTSEVNSTDGPLGNNNLYNVTIPEGQLPLDPKITPGWGVAGTVLLISGGIYALVGIKNRMIHTFFSTAYTVALGISVLIVYVMTVPVSDALQGGYVAAIVLSGCALGAASVFFKELTEALGCALGGFSIAMWLMCLVPGGLLQSLPAKAIFISCFTLVCFGFYFTRFTRDWALIVFISFTGATAVVLGIDCFSRAGLKEFWAYVWDLNKNLFPLGADTYPVTKGIRVETAAIIIISIVGIISQIKLWRIVREKRDKRALEREEGQRNLEQEEADVGRAVEATNARDRAEWERAYGNGDTSTVSGDIDEKKLRRGSSNQSEGIELSEMSDSDRGRGPEGLTEKDEDGKVIVRVAQDDIPEISEQSEDEDEREADDEVDPERQPQALPHSGSNKRLSMGTSRTKGTKRTSFGTVTEPPEVVPLPFTVPQEGDDDAKSHTERSSVATFDDVEESKPQEKPRQSFVNRMSQSSSRLMRNLSGRSSHTRNRSSMDQGHSDDDLVSPKAERDDDGSSIAATFDGRSVSDADAEYKSDPEADDDHKMAEVVETSIVHEKAAAEASARNSVLADEEQKPRGLPESKTAAGKLESGSVAGDGVPEGTMRSPSEKARSVTGQPVLANLTSDRLPKTMSRIALSFRTNEWAKHLSNAEEPEPEELNAAPVKASKAAKKAKKEAPAPVKVEELQQEARDGVPIFSRSESRMSNAPPSPKRKSKRDSRINSVPNLAAVAGNSPVEKEPALRHSVSTNNANANVYRSSSALNLGHNSTSSFQPIAEENDADRQSIAPEQDYSRPMSVSPSNSSIRSSDRKSVVPGVVSYNSPQTLLGQRDMMIRSKSNGQLGSTPSPVPPSPEPYMQRDRNGSDAGSIHNYAMYSAALGADADDVPLSQRKRMMRHESLNSLTSNIGHPGNIQRSPSATELSDSSGFNSHQPRRDSSVPTPAARAAKLASFRSSVAMDLRAGSPMMAQSGRETPFANDSLLGGRSTEIQRNLQMQRNMMLGQKEAEQQRMEMQRREKEWAERAFDERMRNGELMDAHRQAMRKMQGGASKK